jgi:curli biogenesis system outer membrane secretion channel CsgG
MKGLLRIGAAVMILGCGQAMAQTTCRPAAAARAWHIEHQPHGPCGRRVW